jgi:WYL_2, Sm-like SH3 beta-barrel fold
MSKVDLFKSMLRNGTYLVKFTKKDGTERTLICTLDPALLPPKTEVAEGAEPKARKENENIIRVYVTDIKEWRSFNINNLIEIGNYVG